jgi:hypothetical protein
VIVDEVDDQLAGTGEQFPVESVDRRPPDHRSRSDGMASVIAPMV